MQKKRQRKNKVNWLIAALSAVAAVLLVALLISGNITRQGEFVPPTFDIAAVEGTPEVPDELGYSSPYQSGMAYRFSVCGNVTMDGQTATVYLTNPAENEVYLKLRVVDENGDTLGETGLIKPGEYVKSVELTETLTPGTTVLLKIMSYEPDTWQSAGTAKLTTQIGS